MGGGVATAGREPRLAMPLQAVPIRELGGGPMQDERRRHAGARPPTHPPTRASARMAASSWPSRRRITHSMQGRHTSSAWRGEGSGHRRCQVGCRGPRQQEELQGLQRVRSGWRRAPSCPRGLLGRMRSQPAEKPRQNRECHPKLRPAALGSPRMHPPTHTQTHLRLCRPVHKVYRAAADVQVASGAGQVAGLACGAARRKIPLLKGEQPRLTGRRPAKSGGSGGSYLPCARPPPPLAALVDNQQRGLEAGFARKVAHRLVLPPPTLHAWEGGAERAQVRPQHEQADAVASPCWAGCSQLKPWGCNEPLTLLPPRKHAIHGRELSGEAGAQRRRYGGGGARP